MQIIEKQKWTNSADRNLPIGTQASWDGDAAKDRIFEWAGFNTDNPDPDKAKRAFLAHDSDKPSLKGSYKLPFADIINGRLMASTAGLRAAASRLPSTDIPDTVKRSARAVIDSYVKRMQKYLHSNNINLQSDNKENHKNSKGGPKMNIKDTLEKLSNALKKVSKGADNTRVMDATELFDYAQGQIEKAAGEAEENRAARLDHLSNLISKAIENLEEDDSTVTVEIFDENAAEEVISEERLVAEKILEIEEKLAKLTAEVVEAEDAESDAFVPHSAEATNGIESGEDRNELLGTLEEKAEESPIINEDDLEKNEEQESAETSEETEETDEDQSDAEVEKALEAHYWPKDLNSEEGRLGLAKKWDEENDFGPDPKI
jgi:hypothetical protein